MAGESVVQRGKILPLQFTIVIPRGGRFEDVEYLEIPSSGDQENSPKKQPSKPRKQALHPIHRALKWQRWLQSEKVRNLSEVAKKEDLTRARVTQVMKLLGLSKECQQRLSKLRFRRAISKLSVRWLTGLIDLPPEEQMRRIEERVGPGRKRK